MSVLNSKNLRHKARNIAVFLALLTVTMITPVAATQTNPTNRKRVEKKVQQWDLQMLDRAEKMFQQEEKLFQQEERNDQQEEQLNQLFPANFDGANLKHAKREQNSLKKQLVNLDFPEKKKQLAKNFKEQKDQLEAQEKNLREQKKNLETVGNVPKKLDEMRAKLAAQAKNLEEQKDQLEAQGKITEEMKEQKDRLEAQAKNLEEKREHLEAQNMGRNLAQGIEAHYKEGIQRLNTALVKEAEEKVQITEEMKKQKDRLEAQYQTLTEKLAQMNEVVKRLNKANLEQLKQKKVQRAEEKVQPQAQP